MDQDLQVILFQPSLVFTGLSDTMKTCEADHHLKCCWSMQQQLEVIQ